MISDQEALARIEKVAVEIADLEENTGNGEVNDLMKYALSHVKYAAKVLRGDP